MSQIFCTQPKMTFFTFATKIANLQQVAATLLIAAATSNIKGNLGTSSRNVYEEFQPNPMITFVSKTICCKMNEMLHFSEFCNNIELEHARPLQHEKEGYN